MTFWLNFSKLFSFWTIILFGYGLCCENFRIKTFAQSKDMRLWNYFYLTFSRKMTIFSVFTDAANIIKLIFCCKLWRHVVSKKKTILRTFNSIIANSRAPKMLVDLKVFYLKLSFNLSRYKTTGILQRSIRYIENFQYPIFMN